MDIEHQHFFFNSNYHNYNARGMLQRTRIDPTCNSSVAHSRKTIKFVYFPLSLSPSSLLLEPTILHGLFLSEFLRFSYSTVTLRLGNCTDFCTV